MLHRLRTRRDLDPILLHDAVCVLHDRRRDITIPLNLALPQTSWRILREGPVNLVEAGLLAAGTRIEHEDLHLFDGCSYLSKLRLEWHEFWNSISRQSRVLIEPRSGD